MTSNGHSGPAAGPLVLVKRVVSSPRSACGSFLLAMFGHAGPVCIDLLVTPEVLRVAGRQNTALVNRLRAFRADFDAAFLCIAWRCERGQRDSHSERGQTFLQVNHDESPCYCRPVTRHI